MTSFKTLNNISGWLVFAIAALILGAAAEPTGSLWDCGEFIAGAYKLQVVHPPGAPIFLLVGRLFAWVGSLISDDPAMIAHAVNLLSAWCTAFGAMFICWSTTILARLTLVGREEELTQAQSIAALGAGLVAGLTMAFASSVWFSAVEGEVYAMSTFFTCLTLWAVLKWYQLPDVADADRWLVFAFYSAALSIGVHLLSLLTFPALAMFYYFKKSKKPTVFNTFLAAGIGVAFIVGIQFFIITGIPRLWAFFDRFMVNGLGMPFHSGMILVFLLFGGVLWYGLHRAERTGNGLLQRLVVAVGVTVLAYTAFGMVVIRANSNPPINMNDPSDATRLLPYLNREQYGERPLLRGPSFDAQPMGLKSEERWGRVGDRYEIVDEKIDYEYSNASKTLFPRMGDYSQGRPDLYRRWIDKTSGTPTFADQIEFFWKYQLGWMYWRYFMWNFAGRQNGDQGYYSWDPSSGNWISGISFVDEGRIGNQAELPEFMKNDQARNKYYLIPFFLGLIGLFFQYIRRPRDFAAILALFIITGIGITVYSNQPPNEPRERDYVLVGSIFTFAIWIGLAVPALFELFSSHLRLPGAAAGGAAALLALSAPVLMVTQNWDDHSRSKHYASRDYATNFLESCAPNAIIFTYGDNDTYPLWYCQEVEGIRTDVRVVNLSLIAVDWYIAQLRRKVNDSPAIEMSIPQEQVRGYKRIQVPFYSPSGKEPEMTLQQVLKFIGEDHPVPAQGGRDFDSFVPTHNLSIPINKQAMLAKGLLSPADSNAVDTIHFNLGDRKFLIKDDIAILDIIGSNIDKRPIYWAVTTREEKLLGFADYTQLEGLGLRLVPIFSPPPPTGNSFGIIGNGRVATDIAYTNIMEKWRWGNFDKERLFINRSYMPSLQTMRVGMIRISRQLITEGKKDKAEALADKYFEVFPDFNFPHDQFSAYMTDIYARAGANKKAKEHIRAIAKTQEEIMRFVKSQTQEFQRGYDQDFRFAANAAQTLIGIAQYMQDQELRAELEAQFSPYLGPGMPQ